MREMACQDNCCSSMVCFLYGESAEPIRCLARNQPKVSISMETTNDTSLTCRVQVKDPRGLHLRLASAISIVCSGSPEVVVTISRPGSDEAVDARSPLSVVGLEFHQNDMLVLNCVGEGADAIQSRICELINKEKFGSIL